MYDLLEPHVTETRSVAARPMAKAVSPEIVDPDRIPAPRYEPYLLIHKGLRECMTATLVRLGRMDASDEDDVREAMAELRQFLSLMEGHVQAEDAFIHPAMEARAPGSTKRVQEDHASHGEALTALRAACDDVEASQGAARAVVAQCLYRRFALFVAEDFVHMNAEETENTAVLWATYSDDELHAIVARLVASIPPAKLALYTRWMVTASTPDERARFLSEGRHAMPAAAFDGLMSGILPHLAEKARGKLERALQ